MLEARDGKYDVSNTAWNHGQYREMNEGTRTFFKLLVLSRISAISLLVAETNAAQRRALHDPRSST